MDWSNIAGEECFFGVIMPTGKDGAVRLLDLTVLVAWARDLAVASLRTAAAWYDLFVEHINSYTQSVSPDGVFRCTVTELSGQGGGPCSAAVAVERKKKERGEIWEDVIRKKVPPVDDSAGGVYHISWEFYTERHPTVTVLGDYLGHENEDNRVIFTTTLPREP